MMKNIFLTALVGLAVIVCAQAISNGLVTLSSSQKQALVDAHNQQRRSENQNLPNVEWDDTVQAYADQWVAKCNFAHSHGPYGENIFEEFTSNPTIDDKLLTLAVTDWSKERNIWLNNGKDFRCAYKGASWNSAYTGKSCGHWTQVVWRSSTKIGCGVAVCPTSYPSYQTVLVWCNYQPPGNVAHGDAHGNVHATSPFEY